MEKKVNIIEDLDGKKYLYDMLAVKKKIIYVSQLQRTTTA